MMAERPARNKAQPQRATSPPACRPAMPSCSAGNRSPGQVMPLSRHSTRRGETVRRD